MDIKFSFDQEGFERALRQHASKAVDGFGEKVQQLFDDVYASHCGDPELEVAESLRVRATKDELKFSDEQITAYSAAISAGRHIQVVLEKSPLL